MSEDDLSGEDETEEEEDCDDDSEDVEEACDGRVSSDGSHVTKKESVTHTGERSPEKHKSNRVRVRGHVAVHVCVCVRVGVWAVHNCHGHFSLQAACGVCIKTGSFCDPPEIPGLAHLLEHSEYNLAGGNFVTPWDY